MPNAPRILGPQFAPSWHRPWFRYLEAVPGAEAGTVTDPPAPAAPPAQAAPVENPGDVDFKAKYEEALQHSRKWETRAKENHDKAQKFDQSEVEKLSEIEKEKLRADNAEKTAAATAAEAIQLRFAVDNGITKEERALLTGTTEDALTAQVAAVLGLRAPATASAKDAGITAAGSDTTHKRAGSLSDAVSAAVNKK